jgi:glutathione synthase
LRLCILISTLAAQRPHFTSFYLAREALARGHEVAIVQYADLGLDVHGEPIARVACVADARPNEDEYLAALHAARARGELRRLAEFDGFWVRTDWMELTRMGHHLGPQTIVQFARLLEARGVRVIPDVRALGMGDSKLYLDQFPAELRPRSIVTLSRADLEAFAAEVGGPIVLKPAIGAEGQHVFLYRLDAPENNKQIFEVLAASGYIYAQEYVHEFPRRSTRVFLCNGAPLVHEGKYACVMLAASDGDLRSNAANGGIPTATSPSEAILAAARPIAAQLAVDGFFLSAIDVVADRVIEVNQMNVGGMRSAQRFAGVNFSAHIIAVLESELARR